MPMSAALPQGVPGCAIHTTPDFADVLLPNGGGVPTQIALALVPAFAGTSFLHYVVPFELDAAFQLTAVTSSNALTATAGIL